MLRRNHERPINGRWAAGIVGGIALFAVGWDMPDTPRGNDVIPTAPALTARTLEQAPLVRVRAMHADGFGCLQHTDPNIPCAMYAPGYKPNVDNQDTPDPLKAGNFAVSGNKWPQPGGKGTTVNISYSYSNLLDGTITSISSAQLKAGVEESLAAWAAFAPLNFTEVADSGPLPTAADTSYPAGSTPNLRFGRHTIDGAFSVLAHAFFPNPGSGLAGDLHFDQAEPWDVAPSSGKIDFIEVCVHEIGHAVGLDHQPAPPALFGKNAIMNPFYGGRYSGPGSAFLLPDDQNGIKAIYGDSCAVRAVADRAKLLPFAAGIKLGAVAAPEKLYTSLRQYRDRVLQGTPAGRELVAAYYQHGPEVVQVLVKRPDLTLQVIQLLTAVQDPIARRDAKTDVVQMPQEAFVRGLDFLKSLEDVVSDEARLAIINARAILDRAQSVDGETVSLDFRNAE